MTADELISQLKKKEYKPLYLLHGEEAYYIDQVADFIEANVMDEADRDFNQIVLYGGEVDSAMVIDNAKQYPFGVPYRVVIVREAQLIGKLNLLASYAENPSPSTILVLCYKYGKAKADLVKPFNKNGVVFTSEKLRDYQMPPWIIKQTQKYNFTITQIAANILAEHIGEDLSRVDSELQKLKVTLPEHSEITPEIIERNIGISKEYNIFELQNALGERNVNKAYKIALNFCQNQKENPNVKTISVLYSYYSKLLAYQFDTVRSKESIKEIFGNMHPYVLKTYTEAAQHYSMAELKIIISILREFDVKAKGVDTSASQEDLLKELIYKILHPAN
ncbi:MAG: DNA polymerase III subunit delta [Bacteroidales bacterium]|nr:DNA polymerase III subunit delta [Bacteroidales bacterium]